MSSFAGLLADRFNKKNVMIISDLVRMVIVLGLFFATTLFQLFLINFVAEIFSLIRQPSREAIVPELVENNYLVKANSLFVVGTYASLPLASLIFGFFSDAEFVDKIVSFGNGWSGSIVFLLDSLTFLLSTYLLFFLKTTSSNQSPEIKKTAISDLKEGLNYFFNNKFRLRCWRKK